MFQKNNAVVPAPIYFEQKNAQYECLECLECNRAIHNPLCPECISREFEQWIEDYPLLKKKVMPELRKFLKNHEKFKEDCAICVKCNNKSVYMCMPCFADVLYGFLEENKASKKIKEEFLEMFNFAYVKELDSLLF